MKAFVKTLIPPLVLKVLKPAPPPLFNSYDEALAACRDSAYEGIDVVKVVVEKNIIFRHTIQSNPTVDLEALRTLIGVGLTDTQDKLHVLDFGGGGGYHHALSKVALGKSKSLKWNVVASLNSNRLQLQLELRIDSTLDAGTCGHVEHHLTSAAVCLSGKTHELTSEAAYNRVAAVVGVARAETRVEDANFPIS